MKRATSLTLALIFALALLASCAEAESTQSEIPSNTAEASRALSATEFLALGEKYLLELDYEQAIVYFTKVIEIEPRNVRAYVGRGSAYVLWDEQLEPAKADFEKAIEIDDKCVDGYLGLIDVYIRQSDFDKALEIARLGFDKTGDDALKAKLDELESGNVNDSSNQQRKRSGYVNDVLTWYHITTYEKGRETGVTAYDASGNEIGHIDTLYDENGNRVQGAGYTGETGELDRITYTYDETGKFIRFDHYSIPTEERPDERHGYEIREYKGENLWKVSSYGEVADPVSRANSGEYQLYGYSIYEYDGNDNLTKTTWYDIYDKITAFGTYADGYAKEYIGYGADGEVSTHTEYFYDEDGNHTHSIRTDAEGNTTRIEN